MKAVQPLIASNRILSLQMRSVGSHNMSEREKEGKKEKTGKQDLSNAKLTLLLLNIKTPSSGCENNTVLNESVKKQQACNFTHFYLMK